MRTAGCAGKGKLMKRRWFGISVFFLATSLFAGSVAVAAQPNETIDEGGLHWLDGLRRSISRGAET
jgi:hypothetical protein